MAREVKLEKKVSEINHNNGNSKLRDQGQDLPSGRSRDGGKPRRKREND